MGKHLSKFIRQKLLQQKQETDKLLQEVLLQHNKLNKSFLKVIGHVLEKKIVSGYHKNARFIFFSDFVQNDISRPSEKGFNSWMVELVITVKILEKKCPKWFREKYFVRALLEIIRYKRYWLRPIEEWKPKLKSEHQKFNELVTYLFAKYSFPPFLNYIFFNKEDYFFVGDFIALAQGGSIRAIRSEIPLSHKMKVEFMQSLVGFRVFEAFRYAQVISLGGDEPLAYHLAYSWLGKKATRDEIFWEKFIRILIAGKITASKVIHELIDYVRFELTQNPAYSLKGRTFTSLNRESMRWHEAIKKSQLSKEESVWKPAFFQPFEIAEENEVHYKMIELLSDKELVAEGMKMNNCVATYTRHCVKGKSSIVSLRKYQFGSEVERMATIDIELSSKSIVQAKARFNGPINSKATELLTQWAKIHEFTICDYL
ncbi:PcfJ domain-containing protein [Emticicia sp. 17c]|uniref:PcfJ domain-containing protein n=1 Tax=Emticicia sp. 17c TaxID=3127704 RepID=UPI00301DB3E0